MIIKGLAKFECRGKFRTDRRIEYMGTDLSKWYPIKITKIGPWKQNFHCNIVPKFGWTGLNNDEGFNHKWVIDTKLTRILYDIHDDDIA